MPTSILDIATYVGAFLGGGKAMLDIVRAWWPTGPKLKGEVEHWQIGSDVLAIARGEPGTYLLAYVRVVNTRPKATTVYRWQIEAELDDGSLRVVDSVHMRDRYWDKVREEAFPKDRTDFPREAVFEQNMHRLGWLSFEWAPFDSEITSVTVVAVDALGKRHKIPQGKKRT